MKTSAMVDIIHSKLAQGERVIHPNMRAYEFVREEIVYPEDTPAGKYQREHFATRNGFTLALRCTSNWFGAIVTESELPKELK